MISTMFCQYAKVLFTQGIVKKTIPLVQKILRRNKNFNFLDAPQTKWQN